jgi:hypothetical protein
MRSRGIVFPALVFFAAAVLIASTPCSAADPVFHLGNQNDQGRLKLTSISGTPGPNWGAFFDADGRTRDVINRLGAQVSNGIPDALDLGGRGVVFIPAHPGLGNSYAYLKTSEEGSLLLLAGIERLTASPDTAIELEFNQSPLRPEGPAEQGASPEAGERSLDDILIRLYYGDDGSLSDVDLLKWTVAPADPRETARNQSPSSGVSGRWTRVATLWSQGCDETGALCALSNDDYIDGESWRSFDAEGNTVSRLAPKTFTLLGLDVGRLLGRDALLVNIQVRTAEASVVSGILGKGHGTRIDAPTVETAKSGGTIAAAAEDAGSPLYAGDPPSGVTFTLEGCKLPVDSQTGLPAYSLPVKGLFVCNSQTWTGGNDDYTTGNLGKSWNELDLVPFRVVVEAGNSAPDKSDFTFAVALDNLNAAKPGFDVVSAPVLNPGSSPSCPSPQASGMLYSSPGLGGISTSIYRLITVAGVRKGTTCVYDLHGRLSLGSPLWPGASLHANLALPVAATASGQAAITTSGIGSRDVSIPVNQISPQQVSKDMSASGGKSTVWNITMKPAQANVSLGNTCDPSNPLTSQLSVTADWQLVRTDASGQVTVITNVYAKNPASRPITVSVSDKIYSGTAQTDLLDQAATAAGVLVEANTQKKVLTHTFIWRNPTSTALNDLATATYTDADTGIAIPGNTVAQASATVQYPTTNLNSTATINDVEKISGRGLTFSVDGLSGASGTFDDYSLGRQTAGSVSWTSATQTGDGSVSFSKTIKVAGGSRGTGDLDDVATLTASDGFSTSASGNIDISVDARVSLVINATVDSGDPGLTAAGQTFTFQVRDSYGNVKATRALTLTKSASSASATVSGLDPGVYTVSEDPADGWDTQPDRNAAIELPSCSGSVAFTNRSRPVSSKSRLRISKTLANPDGAPAPSTFSIYYDCGAGHSGNVLVAAGGAQTIDAIPAGSSCKVSEAALPPIPGYAWSDPEITGSPAAIDENTTREVTVANSIKRNSRGALAIAKTVSNPDGAKLPVSFTIDFDCGVDNSGSVFLPAGSSTILPGIPIGNTCTTSEKAPAPIAGYTWENPVITPASVTISSASAKYSVTVTNSIRKIETGALTIAKTVSNPDRAALPVSFTIDYDCGAGRKGSVQPAAGGSTTVSGIPVGSTCTVTEKSPAAIDGYTWASPVIAPASIVVSSASAKYSVTVTNSIRKIETGALTIAKTVSNPDGAALPASFTIDYDCGTGHKGSVQLPAGGSAVVRDIPIGNTCTVAEKTPAAVDGYAWDNPVITPPSVLISNAGGKYEVAVANSIKRNSPDLGSLKITKSITVSGTQPASLSGSFGFHVDCNSGGAYDRTINYPVPGTVTISDIPGGSICTVTEPVLPNAPAGYSWGNIEISGPASITKGGTVNVTVTNRIIQAENDKPQPTGIPAHTIGYWKNWSSCTGGGQAPVLDQTLALFTPSDSSSPNVGGVWMGRLYVADCRTAVSILNKSDLSGKKRASDPAYNMAAQLLAAVLNIRVGALSCPMVEAQVKDATDLLAAVAFTGTGATAMSATQRSQANTLAEQLDAYNNNNVAVCAVSQP